MSISSFERPQNLIGWARDALAEADVASRSFINGENFPTLKDRDEETGEEMFVVRQINPTPATISRKLTEALNNARHSFDQSLFAACEAIGRPIKDGHYPWSDNPDPDLKWKLIHKRTGRHLIHEEFWDLIRSQHPYQTGNGHTGGNDLIRQIATIVNRKHTVGVRFECSVSRREIALDFETREGGITYPPLEWNPVKKEIILVRWIGDVPKLHLKGNVSIRVLVDAPAPLGIENALHAVELFIEQAQRVLDGFKARAAEIGDA